MRSVVRAPRRGLTSGISRRVGRTALTADCRETNNSWGLLAHTEQRINGGDVTNVVGDLELTVSAGALGVNDTLGNALAVKESQQVE